MNGELCNSLGVSEEDLVMACVEEDPKAAYFPRFQFEKKSNVDFHLCFWRFAVFLHHKTKNLVLAVRGTNSFQDVIADAMADEVDFEQILNKKAI